MIFAPSIAEAYFSDGHEGKIPRKVSHHGTVENNKPKLQRRHQKYSFMYIQK